DLFDDPPWIAPKDVAQSHGRLWMALAYGVCTLGAAVTAISTTFPWFGVDDGVGYGGVFGLDEQRSALARDLTPLFVTAGVAPGTQSWGFVILALAACVALGAFVVTVFVLWGRRPPIVLRGALVALALALVIVCVLEAHAQPLSGDEPIFRFSWGAIVGVAAAVVSLLGAGLALVSGKGEWSANRPSPGS
ncbi:MAG TPA: hypothetical protein VHD39_05505, partial [Acidimicrobiales bacterium]|nr:hypothetical protein [Acidimicrobiales bacterium]